MSNSGLVQADNDDDENDKRTCDIGEGTDRWNPIV